MYIIYYLLIVIVGIIFSLLIIALFMNNHHYVKREIIINKPQKKVFDYLKLLKNQENFNEWAMTDPEKNIETVGEDGTIGYIYSWSGNRDAGQGSKKITNIIESTKIETEINFIKPFYVKVSVIFEIQSVSDLETKVSYINKGNLNYPINIIIPVVTKNFTKVMDRSLITLKNILEKE